MKDKFIMLWYRKGFLGIYGLEVRVVGGVLWKVLRVGGIWEYGKSIE